MRGTRERWLVGGLVATVLAAAAAAGCIRQPEGGSIAAGTRDACPGDTIRFVDRESHDTITQIDIAPNTGAMPEYHDCQRLQRDNAFGPLVAVWAAEGLDTLLDHPQGQLAYAVAQLYNFGAGGYPGGDTYQSLDIPLGFSCLYLRHDPRQVAPGGWAARLVHVAGNDCSGSADPATLQRRPGRDLEVRFTRPPGVPAADLPPVVRWARHPASATHHLTLRCGDGWCDVGAPGFTPEDTLTTAQAGALGAAYEADPEYAGALGPAKNSLARGLLVRGWYDRQELAVTDGGRLRPGPAAVIVPHPVLHHVRNETAGPRFFNRWVPAAYILVPAPYPGKHLPLAAGVTRVYLCQAETARACHAVGGGPPPTPGPPNPAWPWWLLMVGANGETIRGVHHDPHLTSPVIPAGAARWRWYEDDEGLWLRCARGCCTEA